MVSGRYKKDAYDEEAEAPEMPRRRCSIKGCGTWLSSGNRADGRCYRCQAKHLQPSQALPSLVMAG